MRFGFLLLFIPSFLSALDGEQWLSRIREHSFEQRRVLQERGRIHSAIAVSRAQYNPQWSFDLSSLPSITWRGDRYSTAFALGTQVTVPFPNGAGFSLGLSDQVSAYWSRDDWSPTHSLRFFSQVTSPLVLREGMIGFGENWADQELTLTESEADLNMAFQTNRHLLLVFNQMLDAFVAKQESEYWEKAQKFEEFKRDLQKQLFQNHQVSWNEMFQQEQRAMEARQSAVSARQKYQEALLLYQTTLGLDSLNPSQWLPVKLSPLPEFEHPPSAGRLLGGEDLLNLYQVRLASLALRRTQEQKLATLNLTVSAMPSYGDPFDQKNWITSFTELIGPMAEWSLTLQGSLRFSGSLGEKAQLEITQAYSVYRTAFLNWEIQHAERQLKIRGRTLRDQSLRLAVREWQEILTDSERLLIETQQAVGQGNLPFVYQEEASLSQAYSASQYQAALRQFWSNFMEHKGLVNPQSLETELLRFFSHIPAGP